MFIFKPLLLAFLTEFKKKRKEVESFKRKILTNAKYKYMYRERDRETKNIYMIFFVFFFLNI
jgi:hypothetical protein